jgi:anti-anti-sigma factor
MLPARADSAHPLWPKSRRDAEACPKTSAELTLAGEIDFSNCGNIPDAVERLCRRGYRSIRIDLGAVTFIDAATVGAFVTARRRARALGGDVVLVRVRGLPRRVLRLVGLDTVLVGGDRPHE